MSVPCGSIRNYPRLKPLFSVTRAKRRGQTLFAGGEGLVIGPLRFYNCQRRRFFTLRVNTRSNERLGERLGMRAESSGRIRLHPHQNGLILTKGLKVLGNGFAKRLVGSVVFPSEFGPTVKLRVANLLWRQRIAGRTREGFPSFGKGVVGEISEFDAEGQRTGLHNSLVIGVPRLIRLVGKGLDCFNNAWVKTRPKQVCGFQRGIFQSVVQPSGLQGNILILQAKSLKAVERDVSSTTPRT